MSLKVLIVQSDPVSAQMLSTLLAARGDRVWRTSDLGEARSLLQEVVPDLVIMDASLQDSGWQEMRAQIDQVSGATKVIHTAADPDSGRELGAKLSQQYPVVLRQPFTRDRLDAALQALGHDGNSIEAAAASEPGPPEVRVPVRAKITFPYILLAVAIAVAAAYLVSRVVLESMEDRFANQVVDAGKLGRDWMVKEEDRLLQTQRLLANTEGIPDGLIDADAEGLREIALPLAVNYQEEVIEILDTTGTSVLSLRHRSGGNTEEYDVSRGDTIFGQWAFVQNVLDQRVEQGRDKYAGLGRAPWGDIFYVAGPVFDEEGRWVGVVMVGKSLPYLVRQIWQDTASHTTLYDLHGRLLASSLPLSPEDDLSLAEEAVSGVLERQASASLTRSVTVAGVDYSEIIGPWKVRESGGTAASSSRGDDLGLMGTSMAETFLTRASFDRRLQVFTLTSVTFLSVIVLGYYVSSRITIPLLRLVDASAEVAQGNLDVQVEAVGNDEVTVLCYSFNQMVSGLREGSFYRDLLGRTVSSEVREELRRGLASGNVHLEGRDVVATVLMSDIRDFTSLSEREDAATVLTWLNEYFDELVPLITAGGGVVNQFEGDALLAFFGILPRPMSSEESAYQACRTALEMVEGIKRLNIRRAGRGEPPLEAGIGINTGPVTAGGLGSTDRMHYTIIGDTVNATARLERITREIGKVTSAVISQHTLFALQQQRQEFKFESLGVHLVKGKAEQLLVYRLKPSTAPKREDT